MRPLWEMTVIQIEITNVCNLRCTNCTRFVGHHSKSFFMEPDTVRQAIDSLEGFPGRIGLMGGEPTIHPQFEEICSIYREMIPDRRKRELWTSGHKWNEYKPIIDETFDRDRIAYNDHSGYDGKHHPLLVAAEDVVEDQDLMWALIDNCWVQQQWSASVTPKGAFFCEIAAARDWLLDGPGGWPIEKGWWKKAPHEFRDQVERYCTKCSAPLPLEGESDLRGGRDGKAVEWVSKSNLAALQAGRSPRIKRGDYRLYVGTYTAADMIKNSENWNPSHFRTFIAHDPSQVPEEKRVKKAGA